MLLPRVLELLPRPDITATIQGGPIATLHHPETTPSGIFLRLRIPIFSKSRTGQFSATEASHFRAILGPLARLSSDTEFRHHFESNEAKNWSAGVFQATISVSTA